MHHRRSSWAKISPLQSLHLVLTDEYALKRRRFQREQTGLNELKCCESAKYVREESAEGLWVEAKRTERLMRQDINWCT